MIVRNAGIRKFLIFINSISLVIIILFTPLAFYAFNLEYYENLQKKNGVFSVLDRGDVLGVSERVINFFKYRTVLKFNDPSLQVRYADESISELLWFKPDEISHLYDVRNLITKILIAYYAGVFLFVVTFVMIAERNIKKFIKSLAIIFTSAPALIIIFIVLIYCMGKNFPVLFDKFHKIFFPGGNYIFAENSLIISIFPYGFFYDFFIRLIGSSAALSAIFLFTGAVFGCIAKALKNKEKQKNYVKNNMQP
jgi:integral membrane protein (TIGR01906 family)